jgi:hypothetical protein
LLLPPVVFSAGRRTRCSFACHMMIRFVQIQSSLFLVRQMEQAVILKIEWLACFMEQETCNCTRQLIIYSEERKTEADRSE